jgi:hypothetical protein
MTSIELENDEIQALIMSFAITMTYVGKGVAPKPLNRFVDLFLDMCDKHGDEKVELMIADKSTIALQKVIDVFDKEAEKAGFFK